MKMIFESLFCFNTCTAGSIHYHDSRQRERERGWRKGEAGREGQDQGQGPGISRERRRDVR